MSVYSLWTFGGAGTRKFALKVLKQCRIASFQTIPVCIDYVSRKHCPINYCTRGIHNNKSPLSNMLYLNFSDSQHNSTYILLRYGSTSSMAMFVLQQYLQKNN